MVVYLYLQSMHAYVFWKERGGGKFYFRKVLMLYWELFKGGGYTHRSHYAWKGRQVREALKFLREAYYGGRKNMKGEMIFPSTLPVLY